MAGAGGVEEASGQPPGPGERDAPHDRPVGVDRDLIGPKPLGHQHAEDPPHRVRGQIPRGRLHRQPDLGLGPSPP